MLVDGIMGWYVFVVILSELRNENKWLLSLSLSDLVKPSFRQDINFHFEPLLEIGEYLTALKQSK